MNEVVLFHKTGLTKSSARTSNISYHNGFNLRSYLVGIFLQIPSKIVELLEKIPNIFLALRAPGEWRGARGVHADYAHLHDFFEFHTRQPRKVDKFWNKELNNVLLFPSKALSNTWPIGYQMKIIRTHPLQDLLKDYSKFLIEEHLKPLWSESCKLRNKTSSVSVAPTFLKKTTRHFRHQRTNMLTISRFVCAFRQKYVMPMERQRRKLRGFRIEMF